MQDTIRSFISKTEHSYANLLHLTANENVLSPAARQVLSTELGDRYAMSNGNNSRVATFGRNAAYKSFVELDELYQQACQAVNQMLGAEFTTLRCLSGAHAMAAVLLSVTAPGDTVMTVPSNQGGHFCTTGILELSGRRQVDTEYDFDRLTFDAYKIARKCKDENVKAIYFDTSVYLNSHPIRKIRELIGDEVVIIYDASHTLGLMMGGQFQQPLLEGADIISANTHKTFPGPHKAIISFKDRQMGEKTEKSILKNFVSSTQTNVLLSLIITIFEMQAFGTEYASKIVTNANTLAEALSQKGLRVRRADSTKYTYNHQVHLYTPLSREQTVESFLDNSLSVGTSGALGDELFIRLGVQEITRRGYDDTDMQSIAEAIHAVIRNKDARAIVTDLLQTHQSVLYGFDNE